MRKPDFCICDNKDADQLRGNREVVRTRTHVPGNSVGGKPQFPGTAHFNTG